MAAHESDIRVIRNIMVGWVIVMTLLVLWSLGSWAYARYKAAQEDAEEKSSSSSGSSSTTTPKVTLQAVKLGG